MRLVATTATAIALLAIVPALTGEARAQGIPSGTFGTGDTKSRPDVVEEDLVGTPRDIRTVPRAPTLPDLTHTAPELSAEHTIASLRPRDATDDQRRLTSQILHFDFELPLGRGVYAGAEWAVAGARGPDDSGAKIIAGQPMLFGRAVHSFSRERYSVGAGLGLLPPIFTYDDRHESDRLEASTASTLVSIVRPWDLSTFLDRRLTTRPWVDFRVKWRRAVVQARQAIDVNFRTSAPSCEPGSTCDQSGDVQLISVSTLYLGWQPSRELAIGIEGWQVYMLNTRLTVPDRDRSAFVLSPSVRFYYRWVEPAVSLIFPIGSPLLNTADSYFGLRIDMRIWFGGK